jgi:hypothetical protein
MKENDAKNDEALGLIAMSVNSDYKSIVLDFDLACDALKYFDENYRPGSGGNTGAATLVTFYSRQLKQGMNVSTFLQDVSRDAKELAMNDKEINEFLFFKGLPREWQGWIDSIKENAKFNSDWKVLRAKIEKEGILKGFNGEGKQTERLAMQANKGVKCFSHKAYKCNQMKKLKCGKVGHKNDECNQEKKKEANKAKKEVHFAMNVGRVSDEDKMYV